MRIFRYALALCTFLIFWGTVSVSAQTQADRDAERRDVFIILDVSGSMNQDEKFPRVMEYINTEVFDNLLKPGDSFTLISFGTLAKERISRTIGSSRDIDELRAALRGIKADNDFTDIGNAMETLVAVLENRNTKDFSRQVILFITDGKNAPPKESPYFGKDLAMDEKFLSLGQKISKGGWFLYVIGIGETDAKTVADAVPGSIYTRTDEKLSDIAMQSYIDKVDAEAKAAEEAERRRAGEAAGLTDADREAERKRAEQARATADAAAEAERKRAEQERMAAEEAERRRLEESQSVFWSFLRKLEALTGIPASVFIFTGIGLLVLLLVIAVILFLRALRSVEVVVSDNIQGKANTLSRKLGLMKGFLLNSNDGSLPGIGDADKGVFRVERGIFGLRIRIVDEESIALKSPYKKDGVHKLKGAIIEMANGNRIRVAVKKR